MGMIKGYCKMKGKPLIPGHGRFVAFWWDCNDALAWVACTPHHPTTIRGDPGVQTHRLGHATMCQAPH